VHYRFGFTKIDKALALKKKIANKKGISFFIFSVPLLL
jgi:hypothetical protein